MIAPNSGMCSANLLSRGLTEAGKTTKCCLTVGNVSSTFYLFGGHSDIYKMCVTGVCWVRPYHVTSWSSTSRGAICFASRIVPEIDNTLCKTFIPFTIRGYGSGRHWCLATSMCKGVTPLGNSMHELVFKGSIIQKNFEKSKKIERQD